MTHCERINMNIGELYLACKFGYCDCFIGTKYEGRNIEYCYECDAFKEGDV